MLKSSQTRKKKDLPELLAPAGSPEAFRAAVAAGADAVYLSGKKFGARKYAPNFTDAEIEEAVDYAHRRDVRVYVTINTLIHDSELEGVAEYLLWLYSRGVDAVLVQDIGVAALAREIVPLLPLHASTQMTIHNTDGVLWAAEQGFSRVVLARELSLHDITRIATETAGSGLGLEVFAHGALCYSYSGQCLLSSVIGGRSGNRGMCAQPCRKPYKMITGDYDERGRPIRIREIPVQEHYLLSPKDLCTFENLRHLADSPVVSLKIEGRMKSPEYVAIVVSTYRRALDAIASGSNSSSPDAIQDLCLTFNRGLTSGYLFGKRGNDLMGREAPDNRGMVLGIVKRYDSSTKTAIVQSDGSFIPRPGDGLLFSSPDKPDQEFGFSLNSVPGVKDGEIAIKVPHPVPPGAKVFVTFSAGLEMRARQIISHPPYHLQRPVPLDVHISIDASGRLVAEGLIDTRNGKKIQVACYPDCNLVPARSHPLTREQIELNLKKTGHSPFEIRNFTLQYEGGLFIPVAGLNRVRREFLGLAEELMAQSYRPPKESLDQAQQRWQVYKSQSITHSGGAGTSVSSSSLTLGIYTDSPEGVQAAVQGGCDVIYFEPELTREGNCRTMSGSPSPESQITDASVVCRDAGIRFVLKFPRITKNGYLDTIFDAVKRTGPDIGGYLVENCGAAHACMNLDPSTVLYGSEGINIFNHIAACHLSALFKQVTLSPELSRDEIRGLIHEAKIQGCGTRFALIVQGNREVMVSEDCLLRSWLPCTGKNTEADNSRFFGIRDVSGDIFPVRVDGECRSHVYDSHELCLIEHLPSIRQIGINEVVVDARGRNDRYIRDMTGIYRDAISLINKEKWDNKARFEQWKDKIQQYSIGGITAGHFIRGLKE